MPNFIGIDSRVFSRKTVKRDGTEGHFESIIGIGVRTRDFPKFENNYEIALEAAFKKFGVEKDYKYYCWRDLVSIPDGINILEEFYRMMVPSLYTVYVFYTLFSKKQQPEVRVYGRMAKRLHIRLSNPIRSHEELRSEHLSQCFPGICAWKIVANAKLILSETHFHLDFYQGHITEAQEELEQSSCKISTHPNGDCSNSLISTADLMVHLLDYRLSKSNTPLLFENIRPRFPELGEKIIVYPILNQHFPKITPLDKTPIDNMKFIKHPVYWVFKNDPLISNDFIKGSKAYRNLVDMAAIKGAIVKSFNPTIDERHIKKGDYGVYLNSSGKETVENYGKLGKPLIPFNLDIMVPKKP